MWSSLVNASNEKLNMLDIEVIADFNNGIRIVREHDTSIYFNNNYHLLGLGVEDIVFDRIVERFGITEISAVLEEDSTVKRVFILMDTNGKVILNEFEMEFTKSVEEALLMEIMNHGVEHDTLDKIGDIRKLGHIIRVRNIYKSEYQLVSLVSNNDESISFVLFDSKNGNVISYGAGRPFETLYKFNLSEYAVADRLGHVIVLLGMNEMVALDMVHGAHVTIELSENDKKNNTEQGTEQVFIGYMKDILDKLYHSIGNP